MPIDYDRDDDRRLITLTFTDPFTFEEALSQADRQSAEGTWEYAVFYDLRAISRVPTTSQMHEGLSHIPASVMVRRAARSASRFLHGLRCLPVGCNMRGRRDPAGTSRSCSR